MVREWRALPLVSRRASRELVLEEASVQTLRRLGDRRVRSLGVLGPRGTGKRLLLRTLLNAQTDWAAPPDGLEDSDARVLLWLWIPQSLDGGGGDHSDCRVVIAAQEREDEPIEDAQARQALLLLLSSTLLYNAEGEIDADALEQLKWLEKVPHILRVKPTQDDAGVVSGFRDHAPKFVWLARDFKVKWLKGPTGEKMSPKEYFDACFAEETGYSEAAAVRNSYRMYFDAFFPTRDCIILSRPLEGTAPATPDLSRDALRSQFVDAVDKLYASFLADKPTTQLLVKSLMGHELQASQFAAVLETYITAINDGRLPAIQAASDMLADMAVNEAFDAADRAYHDAFASLGAEVLSTRTLNEAHWRGVQLARAKICAMQASGLDGAGQPDKQPDQLSGRLAAWEKRVAKEFHDRLTANAKLSDECCSSALDEVTFQALTSIADEFAAKPPDSFTGGLVESLTHYKAELSRGISSYKTQSGGPSQDAALERALEEHVLPSIHRWGVQILQQYLKHMRHWQAEKERLDGELDLAKVQDTNASFSTEDHKRLYEEQLEQSTQQLSEVRKVLHGELNSKKSELDRLTNDITTMSLKHEVRIKNAESDLEWARRRTEEMEKTIQDEQRARAENRATGGGTTDKLLESERGFHQEERSLLAQQKEMMDQVVSLQREMVQKKTNHIQQVFAVENTHAKKVDELKAEQAEFARQLRSQAKSDLGMLKLAHQRKKVSVQTAMTKLDEEIAAMRERLAAFGAEETASRASSSRDFFRSLSTPSVAVKPSADSAKPASSEPGQAIEAESAEAPKASGANAPSGPTKPLESGLCTQS